MKFLLASTFKVFDEKIDHIPDLGLADKNVVCIITAALGEEDHSWLEPELNVIRPRVKTFETLDIAGKTHDEVKEALSKADIVYVSGGNTYYLLEHIKACNLKAILEDLPDDRIYFGSSAGAIVTGPDINFIEDLDDKSKANLDNTKAIGFFDFSVIPHVASEKFGVAIKKLVEEAKAKNMHLIGLRDDQALYIDNGYVEIF